MVALPFWLSTANTELGGNGWGSNMRVRAGLPVAGMMSEIVNKTAITLITSPVRLDSVPTKFSWNGSQVICEHTTFNQKYPIIQGLAYINIVAGGVGRADGYNGGWQRIDAGTISLVKAIFGQKATFVVTFSNAPDGSTSRYQWTFTFN